MGHLADLQRLDDHAERANHLREIVGETCFVLEVDDRGLFTWRFGGLNVMEEFDSGHKIWAFVDIGTYRLTVPWVKGWVTLVTEAARIFELMKQDGNNDDNDR